eukprot:gene5340-6010_t
MSQGKTSRIILFAVLAAFLLVFFKGTKANPLRNSVRSRPDSEATSHYEDDLLKRALLEEIADEIFNNANQQKQQLSPDEMPGPPPLYHSDPSRLKQGRRQKPEYQPDDARVTDNLSHLANELAAFKAGSNNDDYDDLADGGGWYDQLLPHAEEQSHVFDVPSEPSQDIESQSRRLNMVEKELELLGIDLPRDGDLPELTRSGEDDVKNQYLDGEDVRRLLKIFPGKLRKGVKRLRTKEKGEEKGESNGQHLPRRLSKFFNKAVSEDKKSKENEKQPTVVYKDGNGKLAGEEKMLSNNKSMRSAVKQNPIEMIIKEIESIQMPPYVKKKTKHEDENVSVYVDTDGNSLVSGSEREITGGSAGRHTVLPQHDNEARALQAFGLPLDEPRLTSGERHEQETDDLYGISDEDLDILIKVFQEQLKKGSKKQPTGDIYGDIVPTGEYYQQGVSTDKLRSNNFGETKQKDLQLLAKLFNTDSGKIKEEQRHQKATESTASEEDVIKQIEARVAELEKNLKDRSSAPKIEVKRKARYKM